MFGFCAVSDHKAAINPLINLFFYSECWFGELSHGWTCIKKNPPICAYLKKTGRGMAGVLSIIIDNFFKKAIANKFI
jgi:hypothetical protein